MRFLLNTWLRAITRKLAQSARSRRGATLTRQHRTVLRLEALEDRTVPSTLTVTNNLDTGALGDGSLRGEIAAASSGDTINFDPSLAGQTITLTNGELAISQDLDIEGLGANQLAISGNNSSRIFDIGTGVSATIAGLTITDGLANGTSPHFAGSGGGILDLGTLTLSNDVLSYNQAIGTLGTNPTGRPGGALGGAIANFGTGTLSISSCTITSNLALGADGCSGTSAGNANGGAIANGFVAAPTLNVTDSQFIANVAQAGSNESGNMDATAAGGAINNTGNLTITSSTFSDNQALGGNNSTGTVRPGVAVGGAVTSGGPSGPTAQLAISDSTFDHNQAIGGSGNTGPGSGTTGPNDAFGGAIHTSIGTVTISGCTIEHNAAIAGAGAAGLSGGLAVGGGMDASNLFGKGLKVTVSDCTFAHNAAFGGPGGVGGNAGVPSGGNAWGGGLADLLGTALTISDSTVEDNLAIGGDGGSGGNGGDALGGGIYADAHANLTLMGATIDKNHAIGGAAGLGGSDGQGIGGGLYIVSGGVACADALSVIAGNNATTSNDDVFGTLGSC
jgi:hypothetical protein